MARAQIYVGSCTTQELSLLVIATKEGKDLVVGHPFASPSKTQVIWSYWQLFIDEKFEGSHSYLPYPSQTQSYRDAGFYIAGELRKRGLGENDFEIINGKMAVSGINDLSSEVELEEEFVSALELRLKESLRRSGQAA